MLCLVSGMELSIFLGVFGFVFFLPFAGVYSETTEIVTFLYLLIETVILSTVYFLEKHAFRLLTVKKDVGP